MSLCCWSGGAVCKTVCSAVRVTDGACEMSVQSRETVLLLSSASRGWILLFLERGERTRIDYTYSLTQFNTARCVRSGLAKSLARRPGAVVFSSRATKMYHCPARRATLNTGLPRNVPSNA